MPNTSPLMPLEARLCAAFTGACERGWMAREEGWRDALGVCLLSASKRKRGERPVNTSEQVLVLSHPTVSPSLRAHAHRGEKKGRRTFFF